MLRSPDCIGTTKYLRRSIPPPQILRFAQNDIPHILLALASWQVWPMIPSLVCSVNMVTWPGPGQLPNLQLSPYRQCFLEPPPHPGPRHLKLAGNPDEVDEFAAEYGGLVHSRERVPLGTGVSHGQVVLAFATPGGEEEVIGCRSTTKNLQLLAGVRSSLDQHDDGHLPVLGGVGYPLPLVEDTKERSSFSDGPKGIPFWSHLTELMFS
jgi:hypothetical protein